MITLPDRRRTAQLALVIVPLVWFAAAGWRRRWILDDGFIYLRVLQQVRAGNGPVFNAGERVEVYTSPLWMLILSVSDLLLPLRSEWLATAIGIVFSVAGLALAMAGAERLGRTETRHWVVPFGALVPVSLVPFWLFQSSGLETGLVFAWLGGCCFVLSRWAVSGDELSLAAAVLLGLGVLVRPELALFSLLFVAAVLGASWSMQDWRARGRLLAAAAALPVVYQLFRMGYFGNVVANSAVAKSASSTNWGRGWDYLVDFVGTYALWFPVALVIGAGYGPLALRWWRERDARRGAVLAAFGAGALLHTLYIVAVGGDWVHARLLLPAAFALITPVAVVRWSRAHVAALAIVPWVVVFAFVARPPHLDEEYAITEPFILTVAARQQGAFTSDDLGWGPDGERRRWFVGAEMYRTEGFAFYRVDADVRDEIPLPALATGAVGIVSFAFGPELHVIDTLGLGHVLTARLDVSESPEYLFVKPGHEKPLPSVWLAAIVTPDETRPDPDEFPPGRTPLIEPATGSEFQEQVAWARAALRCPDLVDLAASVEAPLGPRRIVRNMVGAVSRTRMTIPPDPREAYETFCGPGIPPEVTAIREG